MAAKHNKRPKLTLKAAKTIALRELGTAAGLTPHQNNDAEYQRYEMMLGRYPVVISNICDYYGIAYISCAGETTYFSIDTLEENSRITDDENCKARLMLIRDAAACESNHMIKALLDEFGPETCREMLDKAARGMR